LKRPEAGGFLALASTLILFQALSSTASSSLVGLDEMGSVSLIMIVQSTVRALASPLLVIVGLSVLGAILGYTLSYAIAASIGLAILLNHYKEFRGGPQGKFEDPLSTMVRYGFPVYIASLLATIQAPYQNLVLAHSASNVEIGNFNASLNFSALINLVAFPVTTVLFPAFSKLNPTSDNEHLKTMFTLTVKYVSLLLIPSSILVAILSKDLISIIYGGGYGLAPLYLSIYMGIFLLAGLGYLILPNLFNGIGETRETMKMTSIVAFSFLSTAPLAAKLLRVPGLITALIISTLLGLIYGLTRAQKRYGLKIDWKAAAKIYSAAVLASIPTLALTSSTNLHALIDMALGGLSYLFAYMTASALMGAFDEQDLSNLAQILQDRRMLRILADPILSYEAYLLKLRRRH
jgi:O-antigen/teichoic acid export membrane protein